MGNKIASRYEDASIEVLSLKTGEVKVVQRGGYFGRYLGGYLLYVHQRTLFAVPFDVDRLEVEGTPVPLLDDMAADASIGGGQFAFSRNGTFVYLSGKRSFGVWPISWLDGTGKDQTLLAPPAEYYDMRFAPDGHRLAFSIGGDVYVYDWVRETKTRLTFTSELSDFPLWAPDGKHLIFRSTAPGAYSLKWIRADAPGEAQRLLDSKSELRPYSLSPDGSAWPIADKALEVASMCGHCLWM
jgi:dipeptidyl aminopeptidase/acylaminoacyl peptidase